MIDWEPRFASHAAGNARYKFERVPQETGEDSEMESDPLTQVSRDEPELDRVTLELERETAWAMQKHHERRADNAHNELRQEIQYRNRLRIKAEAFDKIARKVFETAAGFREWPEIEPVVDAVEALEQVIKDANHKLNVLIEAQKAGSE